jgi:hypothetical protein
VFALADVDVDAAVLMEGTFFFTHQDIPKASFAYPTPRDIHIINRVAMVSTIFLSIVIVVIIDVVHHHVVYAMRHFQYQFSITIGGGGDTWCIACEIEYG